VLIEKPLVLLQQFRGIFFKVFSHIGTDEILLKLFRKDHLFLHCVCVQLKVVGEGGDPEAHDDDEHSHH
jgi:hypothetical protein